MRDTIGGVQPELSGPWDMAFVESFLSLSVIPIRVATAGKTGPLVQSMWFRWRDGLLWCATQDSAVITHRLAADPHCGFEVAGDLPPYRGVRGQGLAEILPAAGPAVLDDLIERYLGGADSGLATWLLSRAEHEVAIAIRPQHMVSWDYRERMRP